VIEIGAAHETPLTPKVRDYHIQDLRIDLRTRPLRRPDARRAVTPPLNASAARPAMTPSSRR
jgi:hypothetical protein